MSALRISVRGTGIQPHIVGAMIARWCHGPSTTISIDCELPPRAEQAVLLRPSFHRFHAEIGVSPADLDCIGSVPAHTTTVPDRIALPVSPYGLGRSGVDFHQHWLRGRSLGELADLSEYSPSLALGKLSRDMTCRQAQQIPFETGLSVDAQRYAELLLGRAVQLGGRTGNGSGGETADLVFDCRSDVSSSQWAGNVITIGSRSRIPGMASHMALEAGRRWLALFAKPEESGPEEREFNRLCDAEASHLADMEELIFSEDPASTSRPALARKIAVFSACGRIPMEDYEIFAQHEWLTALLARGFEPARHERLAEVMPQTELLQWLADLRRNLAPRGVPA